MKKITFLLALILTITFTCITTGCSCKKDKNTIRLNEVTHSIFYAPLYVAQNNGYFEEEGLTIELTNGGGSDASMTALLSGQADIALMGPETVVYVINQGRNDHPVVFGQLTKRDGSFLVGRNNEPNFDWSNLNGKHLIAGRRGGSPAMSLQLALEKNGYNINEDVNFDLSVAFNMTVPAFTGGTGDYVTVFEPTASQLVENGQGHIIAAVGQESGEIPFTAFAATQSYLTENKEICTKFLKAVVKGYNFIMNSSIESVAESLVGSFPDTSKQNIISSITNYKTIDAWSSNPLLTQDSFNRLQDMLENCGELTQRVNYSKAIYTEIANEVMNSYK